MKTKLARIITTLLLALLVLIIIVELGINAFLFFKYTELKAISEEWKKGNQQLEFNRGKYIDLKTTIEEQRKEIIHLQQRNDRCLDKLDKTIDKLNKCRSGVKLSEKSLSEKDLLE